MKKVTLFLVAASLLPSCTLAWNTPGEDFSGELRLEGNVTSTRNPWVWKVGEGNENLDVKQTKGSHSGELEMPVSLTAQTVVLGKTILTTPAGREGLSPRVSYGRDAEGFSLEWIEPGVAEVMLPVTDENNLQVGTFTFRMQMAAVLRHVRDGLAVYAGVYDDLKSNGLPDATQIMTSGQTPGVLLSMFSGEGPSWLQNIVLTETSGLSHFGDASLRQIEGVYGARIVAGSGELRLNEEAPERWHVSLPVSIEYQ